MADEKDDNQNGQAGGGGAQAPGEGDKGGGGDPETPEQKIARLEEENTKLREKEESMKDLRRGKNKANEKVETLEERLGVIEAREKAILDAAREKINNKYIPKGDADVKLKFDHEWGILNMPETTPEEIEAKARKVHQMINTQSEDSNPLYETYGPTGDVDIVQPRDRQFAKTKDGAEMAKALGIDIG